MVESLPAHHLHPVTDAVTVGRELIHTITESITRQPRSQQVRIGPSEVGQACARKIGYKLLNTDVVNDRGPAWKPTVGTAMHEHLERVFDQYNLDNAHHLGGHERYYVESRVSVGEVNGIEITGTADLFDRVTLTNWDWKLVGPSQLTKYKRHGPGEQYRTQAHLYGRGWRRAGVGCTSVGIVFLPRNGELSDTHIWTEPYDETVAVNALARLEGIQLSTSILATDALEALPTADDWCRYCPYFNAGSTDLRTGCPGDVAAAERAAEATTNQLDGLLAVTQ